MCIRDRSSYPATTDGKRTSKRAAGDATTSAAKRQHMDDRSTSKTATAPAPKEKQTVYVVLFHELNNTMRCQRETEPVFVSVHSNIASANRSAEAYVKENIAYSLGQRLKAMEERHDPQWEVEIGDCTDWQDGPESARSYASDGRVRYCFSQYHEGKGTVYVQKRVLDG